MPTNKGALSNAKARRTHRSWPSKSTIDARTPHSRMRARKRRPGRPPKGRHHNVVVSPPPEVAAAGVRRDGVDAGEYASSSGANEVGLEFVPKGFPLSFSFVTLSSADRMGEEKGAPL